MDPPLLLLLKLLCLFIYSLVRSLVLLLIHSLCGVCSSCTLMHALRPEEVVGWPIPLRRASLNLELGRQVTVILSSLCASALHFEKKTVSLCSSGISVKIFIYLYFICINVSCMYVYALHVFLVPFGEQKRVRIPIDHGVIDSHELLCGC